MRKLLLTFLILGLCTGTSFAGPPSRVFSYSVGATINPVHNTANEDAIFSYLSSGVDTYSTNSIIATDIATGGVGTTEILDGTITSVDISATAAIPYSKLSFSNNIVAGDIATGAIGSSELASTAVIAGTYTACDLTVDADGRITSATSGTIDLTSEVSGDLPIAEGGTGQSTQQAAIDALLPTQAGNSGKLLTTDGTNSSWGSTGSSNVLFTWSGCEIYSANTYGLIRDTTDLLATTPTGYLYYGVKGTTYRTILNFQWVKIASVSTVHIHGRLWATGALSAEEAVLNVDIGGQSSTIGSDTSTSPAWYVSGGAGQGAAIDVSSLTNGTTYDGVIQLKNETALKWGYCSAVTLTGS